MTEKLILLGRPFELEIVHNSPHWWAASEHYARHTFRRLTDFFHQHIPPGPR
jgi:dipeptidyl aminopeptidase/acylaminoacyl peptidase